MKYYISIGGVNYDFKQLQFGRIVSMDSSPFNAVCSIAKGATLPVFDDVVIIKKEIFGNFIEKFRGKVTEIEHNPLEGGYIKVSGYDLKRKLDYVPASVEGYASQKGSTVFSAEIAPSSLTDLTAGTVSTSPSGNFNNVMDSINFGKSKDGNSRLTRKAVMEMLQMVGDAEIYVKKSGIVDYVQSAGVDRTATVQFIHGENGVLSPDIGYRENETRRVKKIIVKGSGVGQGFHFATAGTPSATDKIRQFELPFLVTDATCQLAANSLLSELDQKVKFAKFILNDPFQVDYDIFDSVKLKANLATAVIDETLRIFSIETTVSNSSGDLHEQTTLHLANFRRAVWAKLVNPFKVDEGNEDISSLSLGSTQAQLQVEAAGGASFIQEDGSGGAHVIVSSETEIHSNTPFNSTETGGGFVYVDLRITARKFGTGIGRLEVRLFDGVRNYPSAPFYQYVRYNPFVGMVSYASIAFRIPNDLVGTTLSIRARVTGGGEVEIVADTYYATIGEHIH